jgi:hypothetical protein
MAAGEWKLLVQPDSEHMTSEVSLAEDDKSKAEFPFRELNSMDKAI